MAGTGQLLTVLTRSQFDRLVARGDLVRVWPGVFASVEPDDHLRLRGLDLRAGEHVAVCLGTAAAAFGFDTETDSDLHVLNPVHHQLRNSDGLVVHRRDGAPLTRIDGRRATTPAWTAVEVARGLRRPRALATLDAALRSGTCTRQDLLVAAVEQFGRRGIVHVRELIPLADPRAESPMESEARLMMIDQGLPCPELQFEVIDRSDRTWRLDFAWPDRRIAVEFDGFQWHSDPEAFRRDRQKRAALLDMDWSVTSIVADDVRKRPYETVLSIRHELMRDRAA
ncbi:type IV toxin-antitoxin system AbiEi family antitoxin domain-containing protein [Mycolicibacterium sediminis]|uniref:DUF559 domain-containing protein n=1 Tax=Mycolicibacterium sediminis TaxID=1286180 RepID=A0A7I7QWN3_9MYCO|nr:hypothetical protein MSEDJ_47980 [Mycolicibacterium sediminis]